MLEFYWTNHISVCSCNIAWWCFVIPLKAPHN